jgi:hypothetical protein
VQAVEVAKAAAHAASLAPADVNYSKVSPASAPGSSNSVTAAAGQKPVASVSMSPPPALGALKPVSATSAAKPAASTAASPAPPAAPAVISPPISAPPAVPATESSEIRAPQPVKTASPSAMNSDLSSDSATPIEQSNTSCHTYFSAYGLTPSQTKWIAKNREKAFSQICPAPDPSNVDFVMIFQRHDA